MYFPSKVSSCIAQLCCTEWALIAVFEKSDAALSAEALVPTRQDDHRWSCIHANTACLLFENLDDVPVGSVACWAVLEVACLAFFADSVTTGIAHFVCWFAAVDAFVLVAIVTVTLVFLVLYYNWDRLVHFFMLNRAFQGRTIHLVTLTDYVI